MSRRSQNKSKPDAPAADDSSPLQADSGDVSLADRAAGARRHSLLAVQACFFLSGFSALLYQTAWLRQFSLVFGTSELAVATVLAAYMGGLALGAAIAAKLVSRIRRPVMVYGWLEAGIAASALAVPVLLSVAGLIYVSLLGGRSELPDAWAIGQPLFYLLAGGIVLLVPTALMGATLPLLTRYSVRSDRELGSRVAALYSINTAGAVLGTLVAAFVLLPRVGLSGTVWVGIAGNVLVFFVAARLASAAHGSGAQNPVDRDGGSTSRRFYRVCLQPLWSGGGGLAARCRRACGLQPEWILPLMLVSGANAFLYEVLWTRMLAHVVGGSIYAFATMLAAFLTGIALGGALAGRWAQSPERAAGTFAVIQAAIALLSAGVYFWMQALVPASRGMIPFSAYAVAVMLPATVCIGMTFPLAVRVLASDQWDAARSTARVYSWNTVGAIAGAVLAAFWLIPTLGFEVAVKLAVGVNAALALAAAVLLSPPMRSRLVAYAALFMLVVLGYYPDRPRSVISATAFELPDTSAGQELFFAVGRSSTVLLSEADGYFDLRTNGLPEASILPRGAAPVGQVQQWLTALPLIARPDAQSMLLVGFGGGVALEDAPASLRTIDVVELEPEVIAANRVLGERRLRDPLADSRVHIVTNDARNALRLSDKRFDIVVSQPSHPWTAGASHLFSREYFSLVKEHLTDDGVFVQWMSAGFVDAALLRSLVATLADVFGNVRLYQPAPSVLLFVAADGAIDLESNLAGAGRPITAAPLYYSYMRLNGISDLAASLMLDESGARAFSLGAPLTTDDRNRMATDSRSLSDGLTPRALDELLAPYDPLSDADSRLHNAFATAIDFAYVASRLLTDGQLERSARLAAAVSDPAAASLIGGLVRGSAGDLDGAQAAFEAALQTRPSYQPARFALVQPALAALASGAASADMRAQAGRLSASAAAVVRGWRFAADEDWMQLAALDALLASAEVTDMWFPEAAQLRAQWRTRVAGEAAPDSAATAIRLIDRALANRPSLDLLVLRAAAADVLGDPDAFIESTRYALQHALDRLDEISASGIRPSGVELDTLFRRLRALRASLVRQHGDRHGAQPLADRIGVELERIQVLMR